MGHSDSGLTTYAKSQLEDFFVVVSMAILHLINLYYPRPSNITFHLFHLIHSWTKKPSPTSTFGLSDPTPELLSLIKAHPTEAAARDLLIANILEPEKNPSRAYALAFVLVALRDSPDVQSCWHIYKCLRIVARQQKLLINL